MQKDVQPLNEFANVFQELPCGLQWDRRKKSIYVVIGQLIKYAYFISVGTVGANRIPPSMEDLPVEKVTWECPYILQHPTLQLLWGKVIQGEGTVTTL